MDVVLELGDELAGVGADFVPGAGAFGREVVAADWLVIYGALCGIGVADVAFTNAAPDGGEGDALYGGEALDGDMPFCNAGDHEGEADRFHFCLGAELPCGGGVAGLYEVADVAGRGELAQLIRDLGLNDLCGWCDEWCHKILEDD